MTHNVPVRDFCSCLNAERDSLKILVDLLESEQQALIDGNSEQLLTLSNSKTRVVQQLGKLAELRKNFQFTHADEIKKSGIIDWINSFSAESLPAWYDIQRLVEHMQQLNKTNGTLIQTMLRHNQQALAVLLNVATSTHGLYGSNGQTHIPSSKRILGSV